MTIKWIRLNIPEGGMLPPVWSRGHIYSIPRLKERYITYVNINGQAMFRAYGYYDGVHRTKREREMT